MAEHGKYILGQRVVTIWLTGLSGAGKSTLANWIETILTAKNFKTCILDGDVVRRGLNSDLAFSPEHRKENIRRIAEVSKILNDAGVIVIVSAISPYAADREMAKSILGSEFKEVFVKASIETCENRDVKGLYAKARNGEITDFTGIDSPYEIPMQPDVIVNTESLLPMESSFLILDKVYPEHKKVSVSK